MRRKGEGKGEDIFPLPRQTSTLDSVRVFGILTAALHFLEHVRGAEDLVNEIREYLLNQ